MASGLSTLLIGYKMAMVICVDRTSDKFCERVIDQIWKDISLLSLLVMDCMGCSNNGLIDGQ